MKAVKEEINQWDLDRHRWDKGDVCWKGRFLKQFDITHEN